MSNDSRKRLIKCLCDHPENIVLTVDKTKHLADGKLFTKLDEILSPDKFLKIKRKI